MTFHTFGDLPPEIRVLIWAFSLPESEPEVCIAQPTGDAPHSLVVYTAFPVIMHVCHEARQFVQNTRLSGIDFASSGSAYTTAGCPVPFRPFRPELDTLFCQNTGPAALEDISSEDDLEPILQETRHLAISGKREYINLVAWVLLFYFPKLETLSVVVGDPSLDTCFESYFDAPNTRCKLRRISDEHARSTVLGARKPIDLGVWEPIYISDCMEQFTRQLETLMMECFEGMDRVVRKSHQWWDNKAKTVRKVKYLTQTFVEYEEDGLFRLSEFVE
ncbi:hypothetical protein CSHISOI_02479 [Colletotrichum shisoi]|uniref:2EXR domain-containing protein n=1 Tax=Colletotrichum shisoi TaxID=2078593 RepID=A0A5Q4C2C7_9PEZI|nr:hypothetical protein CSHISOI_02479 [Colletotrichum shisoi]